MEPKRGRRSSGSVSNEVLLCCLCLCFSFVVALVTGYRNGEISSDFRRSTMKTYTQVQGRRPSSGAVAKATAGQARWRNLSGPGSSPPRCSSKCGTCTPCKPVHVPVPPGTPVTTEYYPEAWRCKCGNRLYMP